MERWNENVRVTVILKNVSCLTIKPHTAFPCAMSRIGAMHHLPCQWEVYV